MKVTFIRVVPEPNRTPRFFW